MDHQELQVHQALLRQAEAAAHMQSLMQSQLGQLSGFANLSASFPNLAPAMGHLGHPASALGLHSQLQAQLQAQIQALSGGGSAPAPGAAAAAAANGNAATALISNNNNSSNNSNGTPTGGKIFTQISYTNCKLINNKYFKTIQK